MIIRIQICKKLQDVTIRIGIVLLALLFSALSGTATSQISTISITIHLRGVYDSKISLMCLSGTKQFKSIAGEQGLKNGETTTLYVSKDYLPGEFVLRFDYKKEKASSPYPAEKRILMNDQNLELWVSPVYCNNQDSTWFQKDERENAGFAQFSKANMRKKEKLGLLQQFLMNYDDTKSKFYLMGIEEYEHRRQVYNQWLDSCVKADNALFVSSLYRFEYIPQITWKGTETDRTFSVISHYFDGIDFGDPFITKTSQMNEWMDGYVNLHGQMATTVALRDSLFPAAAWAAIEKAKKGNPLVYGWMVDYFYQGFESNNIPEGMKILEPYLSDPHCLTSKRMEIERRLKGMETLVVGSKAPNIELKDSDGSLFELNRYEPSGKYILLLFWSADCTHCKETIEAVYSWQKEPGISQKLSVVAISLDETETEIKAWDQKVSSLKGWKHLRAPEGVSSKVANDYYVLATPVMILLDARTKMIVALPDTFTQLKLIVL